MCNEALELFKTDISWGNARRVIIEPDEFRV